MVEFDWCDKSVSAARDGLDPARALAAIPKHLPKFVNGPIQAPIEIDERVGGPEPLLKLFPGYNFSRPLEQKQQHLKWLLLDPEFDALPAQLTTMHFENTETHWPAERLTLIHGASPPEVALLQGDLS
jgi:hypothetical protein